MLIDFHTHNKPSSPEIQYIYIENYNCRQSQHQKYCLGIHPWDADDNYLEKLNILEAHLSLHKPWALGEMGLDKARDLNYEAQIDLFTKQLELAKKYQIDKVVIHSVRAFNDIYKILIDKKFQGTVLFHDFNANLEVATQFMQKFNCYFSFGVRISNVKTKANKLLKSIDTSRIFLETDDNKGLDIRLVYEMASKVLNLSLDELEELIEKNFKTLF